MTLVRGCVIALIPLAGLPIASLGSIQYFTDQVAFHQHMDSQGKVLKDVEDFEESTIGAQAKIPFPNSLQNGVPAPTFDFGINATNLIIQTNITPNPCPATVNPSNNQAALWVNGPGFIGSNSVKVGTDEFLNNMFSSIDLIFTTDEKTGVGVDVSTYAGFAQGHNGFIMCVYDLNDVPIGTYTITGPTPSEPAKNFFGVWSSVPIGRLNIWGIFDVPQPFAIDNIEMYKAVPAPGAVGALGVFGALALRRCR